MPGPFPTLFAGWLVLWLATLETVAGTVIDPAGESYSGVAASSEFNGFYTAQNLFSHDVSGLAVGAAVESGSGNDWAMIGTDPGHVVFQLDQIRPVGSIFYAQRIGSSLSADKVDRISVWASSSAPFDPAAQDTLPQAIIPITNRQSGIWSEYSLPATITGRYFLLKVEQTFGGGGNIGGNELRLGAPLVDTEPPSLVFVYPPANATVQYLASVEVAFNEPVSGVDAVDLLINGLPVTNLTTVTPSQFGFSFPQPATGTVAIAWAVNSGICDLSSNANAFQGGSWSCTLDPNAPVAGVVISEFLASNSGDQSNSLHDELGNSVDWIEIYNPTGGMVDLTGWSLTDDAAKPKKWVFPATLLPAQSYLVVFASDRNTNVAGQLHTNFKLGASGDYLALLNPQGDVVSAFTPNYPVQFTDVSYGRDRFDPTLMGYFTITTPGAPNADRGDGFASEVFFSRSSGTFLQPFNLVLSTTDTNSEIRYVLITNNVPSGSIALTDLPTVTSMLYSKPLPIDNTVQVRARAFPRQPGQFPGPPRTECFVLLTPEAATFTSDLPIIVLHNLAGEAVPSETDQNAIVMVFEPVDGVSSMTNPPTLVTRAGINIRGRSTAGLPKSSFAVEAWDEYNEDRDVEFCGMPAESDWVLYAPNSRDLPLMHNAFGHRLARDMGHYSSRTRFAEVFLNTSGGAVSFASPAFGNYNGIYVVEEKIKRGRDRVDVESLPATASSGSDVTGGYIFKFDSPDADEFTFLAGGIPPAPDGGAVQIFVYPDGSEMVTPLRSAQNSYLQNYLNDFYSALHGPNWTNPAIGYAHYFDVDAGIDHHLISVLALNPDAFRLSAYVHKPREGKLTMGPLWDLDLAFGVSSDGRSFNARSWRGITYDGGTDFFNASQWYNNAWYGRMFTDPDFWQKYIDRYQELRADLWSTNHLFALVDELADQVRSAQPREVARWAGSGGSDASPRKGNISANGYSYNFGTTGDYQVEIDFLKHWLGDRLNFIDTNFLDRPMFSQTGGLISSGTILSIQGPSNASIYYTLDGTDPRLPGGALSPNAKVYSEPLVLTNNVRVVARARNLSHANLTGPNNPPLSSVWSGLIADSYYVAVPSLSVTEVMYHPADPASGPYSNGDFEFIELKNVGTEALNLVGIQFTKGIIFTFTPTNAITHLAPGSCCVLVKNRIAFLSRYPGVTNIAGEYTGSLDNAGERLALKGAMKEPILDFVYEDQWHPLTDGFGFSLVARSEIASSQILSSAAGWRPSALAGGSPGSADPTPISIPPVVINEILTHTDPPQQDAVELWNPTAEPAAIGGWFLTDNADKPFKYLIPVDAVIPPGGWYVITESQFSGGANGFSLSSTGEEIYLYSGDGVNLTGYRHGMVFGPQQNGISFGRHVSSDGREHVATEKQVTLGAANSGPKIGPIVINEIHFAPEPFGFSANAFEEFVELHNRGDAPAALYDPAHPENQWRLEDAVSFTFPTGLVIPPGGFLLVVSFDPEQDPVLRDWFRARFNLDPRIPMIGAFQGRLANEGEVLQLLLPDNPQTASAPDAGAVPYVVVERVSYSATAPWPIGAVETGNSLQRLDGELFADDPANWMAAAPTPGRANAPLDTDGDGLPDAWETAHGLNPDNSEDADGRFGDPDGDGANNWSEWMAGTHPNDSVSRLELKVSEANGIITLRFDAISNRSYTIEMNESLDDAWTPLTIIPAQSTDHLETLSETASPSARYYRVLVTPQF